jgi:glycosyltransferase involved in cell wall biosynthesis
MENKLITVFTPTYNRIALLPNCYESLKRQNCRDFLWLIVDDGSQDGTRELVHQWMQEADFEIRYIFKDNGGQHTAWNAAGAAMDTELTVCIDSDDYLTDDAIRQIAECWRSRGSDQVAGIVALNRTAEHAVLGRRLPELEEAHIIDLYCRHRCRRDLKMIYRSDLLKQEGPLPEPAGERDMNPYWLFLKIDKKLPMLLLDGPVCVVNYQPDGMSRHILRRYAQSPRSFAALRLMMISMDRASAWYKLKHSVHLVSSALLAGECSLIWRSPRRGFAVLAFLPGCLVAAITKISQLIDR